MAPLTEALLLTLIALCVVLTTAGETAPGVIAVANGEGRGRLGGWRE